MKIFTSKYFIRNSISIMLGLMLSLSLQAAPQPLEIIKQTSDTMISRLKSDQAKLKAEPKYMLTIVEEVLVPNIDIPTITRKVMGKYWKTASADQQTRFMKEFQTYMTRFYAKAFASYKDQVIEFPSDQPLLEDNNQLAVIKTKIVQPDGRVIPVDYKLKLDANSWKVVDIVIEGISLVINNQKQYSQLIAQEGLDTVITKLAYKNTQAYQP